MEQKELEQLIRNKFTEYIELKGHEPTHVECIVEFDDSIEETVTIKLSDDQSYGDDDTFFYCTSLDDLVSLTKSGVEDFIITGFTAFFIYN